MSELKDLTVKNYFDLILGKGKKQTSYKFYCLKSIIYFIKKQKYEIDMNELACMMCATVYFDTNKYIAKKTEYDRLLDMKSILYSKGYYGNVSIEGIYEDILRIDNKELQNMLKSLVVYVPYLLLSYGQWDDALKGLVTSKRNNKIAEFSNLNKIECLYYFKDKKICINDYFRIYIGNNIEECIHYINKKIEEYFSR